MLTQIEEIEEIIFALDASEEEINCKSFTQHMSNNVEKNI